MTRAIFSSSVSPGDVSLTIEWDNDTLLEFEDEDGAEEIWEPCKPSKAEVFPFTAADKPGRLGLEWMKYLQN